MTSKHDLDNRSNQLNPNNSAFWSSRGVERSGSDDDDDQHSSDQVPQLIGATAPTRQPKHSPAKEGCANFPPAPTSIPISYISDKYALGVAIVEGTDQNEIVNAVRAMWEARKFFIRIRLGTSNEVLLDLERPASIAGPAWEDTIASLKAGMDDPTHPHALSDIAKAFMTRFPIRTDSLLSHTF